MQSIQECSVEGCQRPRKSRGWCGTHHERWRRNGHLDIMHKPTEERFWAKVDGAGICWEWTGAISDTGYGVFHRGHGLKKTNAHRACWEMLVGTIPEGLVLDHLCRNRRCVNPDHLEPVTERENIRRGASPMVSLSDAYLAHRADGRVTRQCRQCLDARTARYKLKECAGDTPSSHS